MGNKAYSYIRMSTEGQLRGDSLRRQLEASREYAAANGLELDESMQDIGISAFRGRNRTEGALGWFLRQVEEGRIARGTTLIIEHFDRLSREHILESLPRFLSLVKAGIIIVTLVDKKVYAENKFELQDLMYSLILMSRAHEESQTKARRIADAWEAKRRRIHEKPITGKCPAWLKYDKSTNRFDVIQERAAIVRRVFEESASGLGRYVITRRLNAEGVPTFGRKPFWQSEYIQKLLQSEAVIGMFQPHKTTGGKRVPVGEPIDDYFPAIIDRELFYKAAQAKSERTLGSGRKGRRFANLFQHLMVCASCGAPMRLCIKGRRTGSGKLRSFYQCTGSFNASGCANAARIPVALLENAVLSGFFREVDLASVIEPQDDKEGQLRASLAELTATLSKKEQQAEALLGAFGESTDVDLVKRKLEELDKAIKAMQTERSAVENKLATTQYSRENVAERQEKIRYLTEALTEAVEEEAYRLRAAIAQALKRVFTQITCSANGRITIHIDDTHSYIYTEFRGKRVWLDVHGASPSQQGPAKFVPLIDS